MFDPEDDISKQAVMRAHPNGSLEVIALVTAPGAVALVEKWANRRCAARADGMWIGHERGATGVAEVGVRHGRAADRADTGVDELQQTLRESAKHCCRRR
jgi:hypothetical protein